MTDSSSIYQFTQCIQIYTENSNSDVSDLTSSDKSMRRANVERCVQRHSAYLCCDFSYLPTSSHPFSDQ